MTFRRPLHQLTLVVTTLALGFTVSAQQRDPEAYAKTLEGAERVARMQVPKVIESLGVKPRMKIADIPRLRRGHR